MEQIAFGPPPLPPKTRRPPTDAATVPASLQASEVFNDLHHAESASIATTTTGSHVVKIRINPDDNLSALRAFAIDDNSASCIRINLNPDNEMIQNSPAAERQFFYYSPFNCTTLMSSGQVSPSDTLDSGTCSDLDTAPPLPTKKNKSGGVTVTVIGRASSLTSDSDDNESSISCDSLNSEDKCKASAFLPQGLLQDIRERCVKLSPNSSQADDVESEEADDERHATHEEEEDMRHALDTHFEDDEAEDVVEDDMKSETLKVIVEECTYEERRRQQVPTQTRLKYESDKFISFHLNEIIHKPPQTHKDVREHQEDESFAGYKDLLQCGDSSTIRSAKGTIRGVKNRVRAGIATFLSINDQTKTYKEKDAGKVVVYTTTMGIVRETYHACMKVKQILRTQLVRFEERDVFMSADYQAEIRDRMRCADILVPQVFVDGQHIGDAETVEKLNETGELRRILKPYKTMDACTTCKMCGGYNLLPCPVCNGSKKSVHRNHFTAEFVALKCMNCDEVGLVKCTSCAL